MAIAAIVVALGVAFVALQVEVPGVLERGDALARALPLAIGSGLGLVGARGRRGRARAARRRRGARSARVALFAVSLGVALAIPLPPLAWLDLEARSAVSAAGAGAARARRGAVALGLAPLALAGFLDLRGSAEWFIAARYLVAKRRQTFISVITGICVAGVAAGVWLIITVLSVMNGFERTWREEIIGNRAHFTVQSGLGPFGDYDQILARVLETPGVLAGSPFVQAEGMVRGRDGEIVGVRLQGVDPARVGDVTQLREDLIEGSLDGVARGRRRPARVDRRARASEPRRPRHRGRRRSRRPRSALQVGDALLLISPFGGPPTPLGASPRLMRFRVAGVFRSSAFQGEEVITYTSLEAAQEFKRSGDVVDGIEVRTSDYYRSARIAEGAQIALGFPFYTRDWKEFFPAFFQALKTERVMMFVLLTMIMVVAAFAIVVTLIMMIMEKASDIAILKAMGARDAAIERIFAIEGALIGLVGTVLGVVSGIAVTTRLDWIQHRVEDVFGIDALPANVYQGVSELPAQLDAVQIAAVVAIAMALALGGTWIPSGKARGSIRWRRSDMSDGGVAGSAGAGQVPLVEVKGLWKRFQTGERTIEVLRGVDLEIQPGESRGDRRTVGHRQVHAAARARRARPAERRQRAVPRRGPVREGRRRARRVPQRDARLRLPVPSSAARVLGARERDDAGPAARARLRRDARARAPRSCARSSSASASITASASSRAASGSAWRSRARWCCEPTLVLADEPTGNLDPATGERIGELLLAMNRTRGTALVVVTHSERLAARMGRVLVLAGGDR